MSLSLWYKSLNGIKWNEEKEKRKCSIQIYYKSWPFVYDDDYHYYIWTASLNAKTNKNKFFFSVSGTCLQNNRRHYRCVRTICVCVCVVDDCSSVANNTMDKKKFFISLKIQPDLFFHFSLFCHCVYWQLSPEQNRKWSFSFCCRIVSVDKLFATIGMPNKYHYYHHHHH